MPANVTPEYKKAQEAFRKARSAADRLHWLKEMLRTIPKHKGTEHLQADIKTRIRELTEELAQPRRKGARAGPLHSVPPEGAAQVALVGPPNAGKSMMHAKLTGSHAESGPYPYTTHTPLPGMLPFEDVLFQLVDLPPVSSEFMEPWMPNALQPAQAAMLVVDLSAPGCVEDVAAIRARLREKRILLTETWDAPIGDEATLPGATDPGGNAADADGDGAAYGGIDDPFQVRLPTLLVANKSDLNPDTEEVRVLEELIGVRYPFLSVSAASGSGLDRIGPFLFRGLGVVRVYTKIPGGPADMRSPYTLFRGATVTDVAALVHRDLAASLRFARIWGSGRFDGQQVGREHPVSDGDVLELHA